jgi:hypothetical protein
MVLDLTGGGSTSLSWGLTFGSMGIAAALGAVLLHRSAVPAGLDDPTDYIQVNG